MLPSVIRTIVPVIAGVLIGWAARAGLDLPEGPLAEILTVVITGAYYGLGRWLEQRWPAVGRWWLAAGLTKRQPDYDLAA